MFKANNKATKTTPMLFIAHTVVVLSDNTFIWVCFKCLPKLLSPNKTAFSSKTLMC